MLQLLSYTAEGSRGRLPICCRKRDLSSHFGHSHHVCGELDSSYKGRLQRHPAVTEVTRKETPNKKSQNSKTSVGMKNESQDTIHQEFLRATSPLSKCLHLVTLSTPVPKFSGWALLCHGRKGDCIHSSVCPRPCKCTDSGFRSEFSFQTATGPRQTSSNVCQLTCISLPALLQCNAGVYFLGQVTSLRGFIVSVLRLDIEECCRLVEVFEKRNKCSGKTFTFGFPIIIPQEEKLEKLVFSPILW